jgi:hypothetical protein
VLTFTYCTSCSKLHLFSVGMLSVCRLKCAAMRGHCGLQVMPVPSRFGRYRRYGSVGSRLCSWMCGWVPAQCKKGLSNKVEVCGYVLHKRPS